MEKIDLFKIHKSEYVKPKNPVLVDVRAAKYLAADGAGEPGETFQATIGALFQVAYTLKMTRKFAGEQDYKVCTVEALWWPADPARELCSTPMSEWCWKLMIRVPDFIKAADLKAAVASLEKKGKGELARSVRIEKITEGRVVQMLHVGPYSEEGPALERMKTFAAAQGLTPRGAHHEIYLSDPRRVPPERLKTILRQPVG